MRRYTVVPTPNQDEGGYTFTVPALPGCTEGDDAAEALEHARDAIRLYLRDLTESSESLPEETAPPELAAVEV